MSGPLAVLCFPGKVIPGFLRETPEGFQEVKNESGLHF